MNAEINKQIGRIVNGKCPKCNCDISRFHTNLSDKDTDVVHCPNCGGMDYHKERSYVKENIKMKYIHISKNGTSGFDKDFFHPIKNLNGCASPSGGFWASPIDAKYGWKEWCEANNEFDWLLGARFIFEMPDSARVLRIEKVADIPCDYINFNYFDLKLCTLPKDGKGISNQTLPLDFEKLAEKYDAIEILAGSNYDLYYTFYGWDCDSILIMNPDIIKEAEE